MKALFSRKRTFKRMVVNILSMAVILAMAFPAMGGVHAQEPSPYVRANPVRDNVDGWYFLQEATLRLTIEDPATTTSPDLQMDMPGTVDPNLGSVWFDFAGTYDLKPGDEVTMSDGTTTKNLVVSTHEITDVDLEADMITGTAEPGTQVRLPVPAELFATANANGDWLADFTQIDVDLQPGTMFIAEVFDEDGDNSTFDFYVPNPHFEVRDEADSVAGWDWQPNTEVSISVDGVSLTTAPVDASGYFNIVISELLNIVPGMVVQVSDNTNTKTLLVSSLSITRVDVGKDVVSGIATPGSRIQAGICGPDGCANRWERVDKAGKWSADFLTPGDEPGEEQTFDLGPGSWVESWEWDEDGDNTIAGYYIPNPRMVIFPEWEFFDGHDWPDGATVKITVKGKPECKVTKESWGNFFNGNFGEGCDVVIGDQVTFADRSTTLRYVVRNLAITAVDPGENTITGIADPGTAVYVWPHDGWFEPLQAVADDSGVWEVDLDVAGYDIQPGSSGRSELRDETGNATAVDWRVPNPVFEVRDEANSVAGWEWQSSTEVNISVDGVPIATAQVDEWGYFGTILDQMDLIPGMQVEVTDGVSTKGHVVSTLSIHDVDVDTELVTGIATPYARIQAQVCKPDGCIDRWETVSDMGSWTADFSVPGDEPGEEQTFDFVPGSWVDSREWDEDGDNTVAGYYIPNPRMVVFPEWEWFDGLDWPDGVTVNISVEGKPDCATTKKSWRNFFNGSFGEGCNLEIGDTVTFTDGTTTRQHVVHNLGITAVDPKKDTIAGIADAGTVIYVWPHDGWFEPLQVTAKRSGAWNVDLGDVGYDIQPGASGRSEIRDDIGNATAVDWHVPNPGITIYPDAQWVDGWDWSDGSPVTITVEGKPACAMAMEPQGGQFFGGFPEGCSVTAGDVVYFTDRTTTIQHTVQNLAITKIDKDADTVSGVADTGAYVHVWVWDTDDQHIYVTAQDGQWLADFGALGIDLDINMGIQAEIRDENGNGTSVDQGTYTRMVASITENWFYLIDFDPLSTLSYSIYKSQGGPLIGYGTYTADINGYAWVDFENHSQDLEPGNHLVVSDGQTTKDLVIEPFTFDSFDLTNGQLKGTVPGSSGREVWVGIGWLDQDAWMMTVTTDADGAWLADFNSPVPADYWWVAAQIFDADGDASELRPAQVISE